MPTEIGIGTFTLSQSNGGEFKLTINELNGQTQPAIVTLAIRRDNSHYCSRFG